MPRSIPNRALERDIKPEAQAQSSGKLTGVAGRARLLPIPEAFGGRLDWSTLCLPRNILGFLREKEVHDIKNPQSHSSRSGEFRQSERFALLVLLEGDGTIGVDSSALALEEGDALLLFPQQRSYQLHCPKEFSWLYFTFALDDEHAAQLGSLRDAPRTVQRKVRRSLSHTLDSYQSAANDRDALKVSLLLGELIEELQTGEPVNREAKNLSLTARTRKFVFENLEREVGLDEMAREMECTPSALKDEFRRATGDSLGSFVRSARLVLAARYLREGDDSPEEVARRCGFKSLESFTEAFEGLYRYSPVAYQASQKA